MPHIPIDPYSDPSSSDSYLLYSYDSLDSGYVKCAQLTQTKQQAKDITLTILKRVTRSQPNYLRMHTIIRSKIKIGLVPSTDPSLFTGFCSFPLKQSSQFKETFMMLMEYPSIIE